MAESSFYDDGTGLCYWCPKKATTDYCGLPLCDEHADAETLTDQLVAGNG
jgi:hypothetical protein